SARERFLFDIFPAIYSWSLRCPLTLLVQRAAATLAAARFGAVRQNGVADAGVLAAASANHHHVGNVDGGFLFDDPALDVLRRVGTRVALHDGHMLDHHAILFGVDRKHPPALTSIWSGHDPHLIALADTDGVARRPFVSQCHRLPNLRGQ